MKTGMLELIKLVKKALAQYKTIKHIHLYIDLLGKNPNCIDIMPTGEFVEDKTVNIVSLPDTIEIHLGFWEQDGCLFTEEQVGAIVDFRKELVSLFPDISINHPIGDDDII